MKYRPFLHSRFVYIVPLEARYTVYLQDNMVRWLWNQVNQYFTLLGVFIIGLQIVKSFPIGSKQFDNSRLCIV